MPNIYLKFQNIVTVYQSKLGMSKYNQYYCILLFEIMSLISIINVDINDVDPLQRNPKGNTLHVQYNLYWKP